jgi:hypothetical protein
LDSGDVPSYGHKLFSSRLIKFYFDAVSKWGTAASMTFYSRAIPPPRSAL